MLGDDDLMVDLRRGEPEAVALLFQRWSPRLVRFGVRLLGDRHLAEDLAQEVLFRVYRARDRYKPQGKFPQWVYRVAVRVGHNLRNARRRSPLTALETLPDTPDGGPAVDDRIEKQERSDKLQWALAQLPEPQRLVVVLRHFEGIKFDEIAKIVGHPPSTVKSRFQAGLGRLYALLKNAGYLPLEDR